MKILIIGSTGMLGDTLKKYLYKLGLNFDTLDRKDLDFSTCSYKDLHDEVKNKNCDVIVNCAGLIKQRKNIDTGDFISVNSLLPHRLSKISKELSVNFIHVTTDCVFNGQIGSYDENSKFDLVDTYGTSKIMGEPEYSTVIRTSIIGEEVKNKLSLLEWVKSNKDGEINGFTNHYWNGVTCLQLSKVIHQIISKSIFWKGIRHIYSNRVSKYDLVKMINEIYELNIKINPMNTEEDLDRTLNSIYDISIFNIPNLYKQILDTKNFHDEIRGDELQKYYENLI